MTVKDVAPDGVQVETLFPLHVDSVHEFRLVLDQPVVLRGRVAHCGIIDVNQDLLRYRSGLHFVDVPAHVRHAIDAFIDAKIAARRRRV